MASDKRPILSGKRIRNRRKRAALRAANRSNASPTPECDSDDDAKQKQQEQHYGSRDDSTSSDKTASQSENEEGIDPSLVFVCRPTMPDFCTVFQPRGEDPKSNRSCASAADCKTFTVHVPTFQETCEGYVTYTLELITCDAQRQTFQVERRFSEFVACAVEINKQLASGFAARCCALLEDEESKVEDAEKFQWELPAKTWFRMTQTHALEERRAELQRSLETLLLQQNRRMCNLPVIRDFLMLDIFGVQVAEHKNLEAAAHFE
ncbi:uncharacterized protein PITG_13428 [Phytophthora infestans T30-4]|uniref:PX domain-containing protein n=2 Tax=Phytophthora infestans TaxID=4787 RepID=D0NLZ1_PHYIT|nr:uncharacterized protein PITG_13428 [Phytophthora infestans T30-4]EEY60688.1 conserved hypothetical protein [Phytophthora infestans T30-4]KAF4044551.1 PX domain-containing protein [Phytophthora infestans]KAF4148239.1 PX domain-containing protein [Phytophthora infestans]KAI9987057.1 hypothetical protein PInf_022915 [Phytophthora infestans]|eukprot:XP_002900061.1 conserved hypothetical protein [Phytophthora infestans T30-4]